jgi:hypothetical protein
VHENQLNDEQRQTLARKAESLPASSMRANTVSPHVNRDPDEGAAPRPYAAFMTSPRHACREAGVAPGTPYGRIAAVVTAAARRSSRPARRRCQP